MRTHAFDPAEPSDRYDDKRLGLWVGMLTGPLAFLTNLQIGYSLADFVCAGKVSHVWLHIVPWSLALITVLSFISALKSSTSLESSLGSERKQERRKFMRHVGLISSALFTLLIIMQWAATLYIDPCAK